MSVVFRPLTQLGPNDLKIILFDSNGNPFDPYLIYYEFYGMDDGKGSIWRVGLGERIPHQEEAGVYYVAERLSTAFLPGNYYIQWVIKKDEFSPLEVVKKQEFAYIYD
jgi:hypothetical protein